MKKSTNVLNVSIAECEPLPIPYYAKSLYNTAMPIKIDSGLPARQVLERENIFVMSGERASTQDIRPLEIAIVNLMPAKEITETQLLRLLSNTPLQINICLVRMDSHVSRRTENEAHLSRFYMPSTDMIKHKFDGLIITGAPVEQMMFEEVDYWNELTNIMDWAKENVFCTLYICWGAMAGLYHNYGIMRKIVKEKFSGIYYSRLAAPDDPLMRGFDDFFPVPTSRYTTISAHDIQKERDLVLLASSEVTGMTLAKSYDNRCVFMTGHLEYDGATLALEYERDINKGLNAAMPINYFTDNDPSKPIYSSWRSTAHLFYSNWLNYYVYQETPYQWIR